MAGMGNLAATRASQAGGARVVARTGWTTAEELLALPDDGYRYELLRGELKRMSPAGNRHGRLAANIAASLWIHVRANGLGTVYAAETGYQLASAPDHVRAPDVSFIGRERLERTGETDGYWPGAPDLAVEVVSPGDRRAEVEEKVRDWLDAGAGMVLVVDFHRGRTVRIHRPPSHVVDLTGDDVVDGGDVVPGWRLPVSEIFDS